MPPPSHRPHPHPGHPGPHGDRPGPAHAPHPRRTPVPASRALAFVDDTRLDAALARLVPAAADRAFVRRCLVGEGPVHHRGANYVLVMLLDHLLQASPRTGGSGSETPEAHREPVPMRLPPHLAEHIGDAHYPIELPTGALSRIAGGDADAVRAMIDCLTDGPPQHAVANVVLVALVDQLLHDGERGGR